MRAIARRHVDRQPLRLLHHQLVLSDQLAGPASTASRVVRRVVTRRTGARERRRQQRHDAGRTAASRTHERRFIGHLQATPAAYDRQVEVVGEIDLDPIALADRDRRQHVQVPIEHAAGRGREARARGLPVRVAEAVGIDAAARAVLREAGQRADGERRAEDLQVVAIDLSLRPVSPI